MTHFRPEIMLFCFRELPLGISRRSGSLTSTRASGDYSIAKAKCPGAEAFLVMRTLPKRAYLSVACGWNQRPLAFSTNSQMESTSARLFSNLQAEPTPIHLLSNLQAESAPDRLLAAGCLLLVAKADGSNARSSRRATSIRGQNTM